MQPSNDSAACLGAVASAAPVPISLYFSVNVIALPVLPDSLSLCKFFIFYPFCVCVVPVPVCQGQWKAFLPPFFETGEGGAVLKKVISQACVPGPTTTLALSHSAESFVHTHIVCSPLHSFFFPLPVSMRKWMPAIVARKAVCVCGMRAKACRGK